MRKSFLKIFILTFILIFMVLVSPSEAGFWSDIFKGGDDFLEKGKEDLYIETSDGNNILYVETNDSDTMLIMNDLYSILFPLGVVVTVIVGGVLGIKFMLASAEDKAKIKESMMPYVIGCIVIYGAFGIWRICIEIFSNLS